MSDICKCMGTDCPIRDSCYRFTAPANEYRQTYFAIVPAKIDGHCEEYWANNRVLTAALQTFDRSK